MSVVDIEALDIKFQALLKVPDFPKPTTEEYDKLKKTLDEVLTSDSSLTVIKSKHKLNCKNSYLLNVVNKLKYSDSDKAKLKERLRIKHGKSDSGVVVITVFMSDHPEYFESDGTLVKQEFSCAFNCSYCPKEPGQPRSYLAMEPGVLRANRNQFDPIKQMWDRMSALEAIGTTVNKLEIIVLGGTYESYPLLYREQFIASVFYAANCYNGSIVNSDPRSIKHVTEEKRINWDAEIRIIGLTIETRPDTISVEFIKHLRAVGCTRVQLGVQHLNDSVLQKVNRKCGYKETVNAIKLLKDCCFKVDIHIMPNLPGSSPELDKAMLLDQFLGLKTIVPERKTITINNTKVNSEKYSLSNTDVQVDQWKIYPCEVTPFTEIKEWFDNGSYKPYSSSVVNEIILQTKSVIFPWIRLNRIIRDIPGDYIISGSECGNMRQYYEKTLLKDGWFCYCIRCREVKSRMWNGEFTTFIREYESSGGKELFISAESEDSKTLYGFLRLRITNNSVLEELDGCSLIRELHVYGPVEAPNNVGTKRVQHRGVGKHLMEVANKLSKNYNKKKIAVIAGEGVVRYYEKLGFNYINDYMIKEI